MASTSARCTPQTGSRTSRRAFCPASKSLVVFNGSRLWPGCNKPEISRPARRTPHETITTQNKILINRAKKVIALLCNARLVSIYELMMMSEFQSASAERQRRPIARNSPKDAVNRVYARSKGRVKRKGVISVSCEGSPQSTDQPNGPKKGIKLRLFLKLGPRVVSGGMP